MRDPIILEEHVTTPEDPFAKPAGEPTPGPDTPPPGYGTPPPGYGTPPPGYGGTPSYGGPGQGSSGGGPYGGGGPPGSGGSFGPGSGRPELAGWGTRVGGTLLDGLAAAAIYVVFVILGAIVGGGAGGLLIALGFLGGLGFIIYNLVQQGNTGQTIGKRAVGTRLLREQDGQVVGPGLSIGRQVLHIVDSIPLYIGYLWPLWDEKHQTFADKIAKTVVVKA